MLGARFGLGFTRLTSLSTGSPGLCFGSGVPVCTCSPNLLIFWHKSSIAVGVGLWKLGGLSQVSWGKRWDGDGEQSMLFRRLDSEGEVGVLSRVKSHEHVQKRSNEV